MLGLHWMQRLVEGVGTGWWVGEKVGGGLKRDADGEGGGRG